MPFNLLSDQVFESLIRSVLEGAGYDVERADTSLHQRAIMENVIRGLQEADLVLADLTGRNPNVFYELGIAHALKKPVVMIAQSSQDIPFDVTAYHVHIYPLELQRPARLKDTLTASLGPVLDGVTRGEVVFTNPFTDYGLGAETADLSPEPDGLLDAMARVQRDLPAFTSLLKEAGEVMAQLGVDQAAINRRIAEAPEGQEIEHALQMAADAGALWDRYAERFEEIVDKASPLTGSIETGTVAAMRLGRMGDGSTDLASLQGSILEMAGSARDSATMLVGFAQTVRELSELSGSLRRPGDRLATVMERLAAQMGRIGGLSEIISLT